MTEGQTSMTEWRGTGEELLREIQANVGCRGAAAWLASLHLGPSDVMKAVAAAVAEERRACAELVAAYRPARLRSDQRWVVVDAIEAITAAIRSRGEAT